MANVVAMCMALAWPVAASGEATEISRAIDQRQYDRALSLLAAEVEKHPDDATAWFDTGRVIATMNQGNAPDDYCDVDENWIFLTLGNLSEAARRDPARIESLIANDTPAFAAFKRTPEFEYWWTAMQALPESDASLRDLLRRQPVWNRENPKTSIREALTLRPDGKVMRYVAGRTETVGTWTVERVRLTMTMGKRTTRYPLTKEWFAVRHGTLRFPVLTLGGEWTLGRILHDCTF
jgi:hypothetical protein